MNWKDEIVDEVPRPADFSARQINAFQIAEATERENVAAEDQRRSPVNVSVVFRRACRRIDHLPEIAARRRVEAAEEIAGVGLRAVGNEHRAVRGGDSRQPAAVERF